MNKPVFWSSWTLYWPKAVPRVVYILLRGTVWLPGTLIALGWDGHNVKAPLCIYYFWTNLFTLRLIGVDWSKDIFWCILLATFFRQVMSFFMNYTIKWDCFKNEGILCLYNATKSYTMTFYLNSFTVLLCSFKVLMHLRLNMYIYAGHTLFQLLTRSVLNTAQFLEGHSSALYGFS